MPEDLRPRGVGEILDAAVTLFRARFWRLVRVVPLVVIPLQVLTVLVTLSATPDQVVYPFGTLPTSDDPNLGGDLWLQMSGAVVVQMLAHLATALVVVIVTQTVADSYTELPAPAPNQRGGRFTKVVVLSLLVAVATGASFVLCFPIGIWLDVSWAVAVPALLLERRRIPESLKRSFALTKLKWWHCFSVAWAGNILAGVLSLSLAGLFAFAFAPISDSTGAFVIAQGVASGLASLITAPLLATAIVVLYFDLRIRGEGFDVQVMMARLDVVPAARGPDALTAR